MSIKTWKQEFYEVEAREVPSDDFCAYDNEVSAIQHSLRKWRGLTLENLDKHGLAVGNADILEVEDPYDSFDVDGSSCALCRLHNDECTKCSLFFANGKKPCDSRYGDGISAYSLFRVYGNPTEMIKLLELAQQMVLQNPDWYDMEKEDFC